MKSFKQYIKEATLDQFHQQFGSQLHGYDSNHINDVLNAFNNHGFNLKDENGKPKKNLNQWKNFNDLHMALKPHVDSIQQTRQENEKDKEAFKNGDVHLIHHDPVNGVKIFKPHNQTGSCAVGKGTKWCTGDRNQNAFGYYDTSGNNSYVMHFDKEKGNLSRIGIFGVDHTTPHKEGVGGNFQDKSNVTVSDDDWNNLRKKYNLDSIPELSGIRGIPRNKEQEDQFKKKNEYFDKIVSDPTRHRTLIMNHMNGLLKLSPEHLNTIINNPDPKLHNDIIQGYLNHKIELSPEHLTKVMEYSNYGR